MITTMNNDTAADDYGAATNTSGENASDDYLYKHYGYPDIFDNSSINYEGGAVFVYEDYLYFGFNFERPIYVFIWPLLVILATFANALLVIILSKKNLRNSTNIVLIGIAIAETFTLLVTIPVYVMAYHRFDDGPGTDVYVLTKNCCNAFMICKFFLSKWFRTASIWLHCFLGFHRLMAIWRPFSFMHILQNRWTIGIIVILFVVAPTPHIYRVMHMHATDGLCGWGVEDWCADGCHYNWILLLLVDLVPCVFLSIFTIIIVAKLCKSTDILGSTEMLSKLHLNMRRSENRRSSMLVTAVVLSLLIPEFPYVAFLIYTETHQTNTLIDRTDREFHTAYEILIAVSFTTNFFINIVLNRTFRSELKALCVKCCRACMRMTPKPRKCTLCKVSAQYDIKGSSDIPSIDNKLTNESSL